MTKIQRIEMFRYDGKLYDSEDKAQQAEYDVIANYVDQHIFSSVVLNPADKIKIMDAFIVHRDAISELLYRG